MMAPTAPPLTTEYDASNEDLSKETKVSSVDRSASSSSTSSSSTSSSSTSSAEESVDSVLCNPLANLTREELHARVYDFAKQYDMLDDLEIICTGAVVAQAGSHWRMLEHELSPQDFATLKKTELHTWRQITAPLLLTIAAASFGAITLGWDQGVLSGATLHYPRDLSIDPDAAGPHQAYYNWLTGIVSSGPFLGAAGCSVWFSDPLNHYLGRRGTLGVASVFLLGAPLGSAFTQTWVQLFICRLLLGLGIGFLEVTAPVFAAESAPPQIRGAMTINFQLFTAFGIFLGSSANLVLEHVHHNWRFMLASPLIPVPILVLLLFLCPESARWYLKWGKVKKAYESLKRLRNSDMLAARDLYLLHWQIHEEQVAIGGARNVKRFAELFYKNRVRQATLASCVAHATQVLSGINIVCLFSSTIFTELTQQWGSGGPKSTALVGQDSSAAPRMAALWGSWGYGLCNFLFTFPAILAIDKLGRRTLMLFTLPQLSWSILAAGLCFLIKRHPTLELGLVSLFIYLYTALYSTGLGPIAFLYSAESASQTHRELSVALAAFVNNGLNAVLSITFFRMRQAFTTTGVFGFYAGMNLLMFVVVFATVPETKQLSLEELDAVFEHSNREVIKYQLTQTLPYLVRRYIFQQRRATIVPLERKEH